MKKITTIIILSAIIFSAQAQHQNDDYHHSQYDQSGFSDVITVPVTDVQPIFETISVPEKREMCERIPSHERHRHTKNHGGAILGAIVGGVLGNKIGSGNGRKAATAAGVVIGSSIGNAKDKKRAKYRNRYSQVNTRCHIETVYREEEQLMGYDVSYRYNGTVHRTQTNHHPGDHLQLRVQVSVME